MEFSEYFPIWDQLTPGQRETLSGSLVSRSVKNGAVLHGGGRDCTGLLLVKSGQLRAFILSREGREVTLYRLFDRDLCLFSASCIMRSIQFDVTIAAEKDTELWVISAEAYKELMEQSAAAANYTNEIMAARFSEVMWLIEQVMWNSMDRRVAAFLLEEAAIEGANRLSITHETIANHLGTHREVVTRMLRYLQGEGMVRLSRGTVELLDVKKLSALRDAYKSPFTRVTLEKGPFPVTDPSRRLWPLPPGGGRRSPRRRTGSRRRSYTPRSRARPRCGRRCSCAGRSGR